MISLVKDTINNKDIDKLIDWLKTYPRLTKGKVTLELEEKWSKWLGTKYSVFCNSGSSANLLMLSALKESGYMKNNKVVVPSVAWATDLAPVMQLGFEPILVDANMNDLSVDLEHLEEIFKEENPLDHLSYLRKELISDNFEEVIKDKYKEDNESVVASVYNGSCGSCFYSLPAQSLQDAKKGKLITCPNCSIYLYFDEDNQ